MKNSKNLVGRSLITRVCLATWTAIVLLAAGRLPAPPIALSCPSDLVVSNDLFSCSAVVTYSLAATNGGGSGLSVVCAPPSDVAFPVGTNTVTCTATNLTETNRCSFTVTVVDAEPPTVYPPTLGSTVEDVPGGGSAGVVFQATAYDNCAVVSTNCMPSSGSPFMVGTTPVICVATDSSGNTNAVTFEVVVCPVTNVVTMLTDSGPGSLREAIELSNGCPGTNYIVFGVTGTIVISDRLPDVSDPLFILGPGPASLTVARGSDPQLDCFRIFYLNDKDIAWISGLTIRNGCDFDGGGVNNSGNAVLSNCVVTGNTAFGSEGGAGIYNESDLLIVDCSIVGNMATTNAQGGGIYNLSDLLVINSLIAGNSSQMDGGGLYVSGSDVALTNVTFSGNSATNRGGGIYLSSFGVFVAASVTTASNIAHVAGGGIFDDMNGDAQLKNVIVARNTAPSGPDVDGALASLGHNLIGDGTGSAGFVQGTMGDQVGTSGSPINPMLGPLQNNGGPTLTHALTPASPAFNTGTNALAPATDQRGAGFPRIQFGVIDIGAFEAQVCAVPMVGGLSDQRACYQSTAVFSITVTSALPYTVQWCEGDSPIANATNNTFTVTADYDMDYSVKVQNACGTVTNRARLEVLYANLYGPDDVLICAGEPAAFLAEVYANVPYTLAWCKDGVPLPGQTNVLLILSNTSPASAGVYSAKLTTPCGVLTNSAVLELTNPPPNTLTFLSGGVGFPDVKRGAVRWGDYDNDGLLDLLIIGEDSSGDHVFRNNGNGTFIGSGAVIDDLIYCDAAWADFDKDGFLDFVISGKQGFGPSPTVTKVYRNLGGTNFVDIGAPLPGARTGSVAWGDVNNDTYPDLLIAGVEEPSGTVFTALYLNNTMGGFIDSGAVLPGIIFGKASFADYDQDGFLDILVTGADTNFTEFTQLLRNNHAGQFIDSGVALRQLRESSAAWGDCNNDGFPDLLLLGWNTSLPGNPRSTILYTNDGSGGLMDSMAGLPGLIDGAAAWGDYDGDGFQDFVLAGSGTNDPFTRIFRNNGRCQFVDSGIPLLPVEESAVAWGDYDNDGDLDLIVAGGANFGGEGTEAITLLYRNCRPSCVLTAVGPTNQLICNMTLDLCVTAGGTGPFRYQWRRNGVPLPGATNACVTVRTPATYCVIVSNACAAVTNCTTLRYTDIMLVTQAVPPAGGTTSGDGLATNRQVVTVTATPRSGYSFVHWTQYGTPVSTNPIYTFPATLSRTLVAHFIRTPSEYCGVWKLDDGGGFMALDSSGNGMHGRLTNGPLFTAMGRVNGALEFDGRDDFVFVPDDDVLEFAHRRFTLGLWIKTTKAGPQALVEKQHKGFFGMFLLALNRDGAVPGGFSVWTGAEWIDSNSRGLADGQWHHLAVTFDGTTFGLYRDGMLDRTRVVKASYEATDFPLNFGRFRTQNTGWPFSGFLDEIVCSPRAWSGAEIAALGGVAMPITLTVMSTNPSVGVKVEVTPVDANGFGTGDTLFTRAYASNTLVTLTAPVTALGNAFLKWRRNGVDFTNGRMAQVTMDLSHTLEAVYAPPAVVIRSLTLASVNPGLGVRIQVAPNDTNGQGDDDTLFTRFYTNGALVTLTAPATAAGNTFVKWQANGVDLSTNRTVNVTLTSNATMTAHFRGGPGLVGWWKLDESAGTSAADNSGAGHNGTLHNGARFTNGMCGNGVFLDGVNDFLRVADTDLLDFNGRNFTVALKFKTTKSGPQALVEKEHGNFTGFFLLALNRDNVAPGKVSVWTGSDWIDSASGGLSDGAWHHVAVTFDGSTFRLFRDGALDRTKVAPASYANTTLPLNFGRFVTGNVGWNFHGVLDEVFRYNRALSEAEIAVLTNCPALPPAPFPGSVGTTTLPGPRLGLVRAADGTIVLTGEGAPARVYRVEITIDLRQWESLGVTEADDVGHFEFIDRDPAVRPIRFYRLAAP